MNRQNKRNLTKNKRIQGTLWFILFWCTMSVFLRTVFKKMMVTYIKNTIFYQKRMFAIEDMLVTKDNISDSFLHEIVQAEKLIDEAYFRLFDLMFHIHLYSF